MSLSRSLTLTNPTRSSPLFISAPFIRLTCSKKLHLSSTMAPSVPQTYIHRLQIISCLPQLCTARRLSHNCVLLFTGSTDAAIHAQASPASGQRLCHAQATGRAEPNACFCDLRKHASRHTHESCFCGETFGFMMSQRNARGVHGVSVQHTASTLRLRAKCCGSLEVRVWLLYSTLLRQINLKS